MPTFISLFWQRRKEVQQHVVTVHSPPAFSQRGMSKPQSLINESAQHPVTRWKAANWNTVIIVLLLRVGCWWRIYCASVECIQNLWFVIYVVTVINFEYITLEDFCHITYLCCFFIHLMFQVTHSHFSSNMAAWSVALSFKVPLPTHLASVWPTSKMKGLCCQFSDST